jgi:hypothetical protein
MVIEVIGALSLPVWLLVEEMLRLRALRPTRQDPAVVQPPSPASPRGEIALSRSS